MLVVVALIFGHFKFRIWKYLFKTSNQMF